VDPIFKPSNKPQTQESGFELLYREESQNLPAVNLRRSFDLDLVYPVPQLKPFIGKMPPKEFKKYQKTPKPVLKQKLNKQPSAASTINTPDTIVREPSTERSKS